MTSTPARPATAASETKRRRQRRVAGTLPPRSPRPAKRQSGGRGLTGLRRAVAALGLVALLLLPLAGGFLWFLHRATSAASVPAHVDGIVVLTGGADRIETALRLLAAGRADRLLVSGVGGMADFPALARRAGINPAFSQRVTLGRDAVSTHGNAAETAVWTSANGVRSLLVVTAFYHMPRAMAELSRAMPDVLLYPIPVLPPAVPLRLLAAEYAKYLATASGLSELARGDSPAGLSRGLPSGPQDPRG